MAGGLAGEGDAAVTGEFVSRRPERGGVALESGRLEAFRELCVRSWRRQLRELAESAEGRVLSAEEKAS